MKKKYSSKRFDKRAGRPAAAAPRNVDPNQAALRTLINTLVSQADIAPAGYRQNMGIARHLDVDMLHDYIMQAEGRNVTGLFTIMRDMIASGGHVTAVYSQRKLSVLADGWSLIPADKKDAAAMWIAKQIEDDMEQKEDLYYSAFTHLLGGSMWPCAVVQKTFKPSSKQGWLYEIDDLAHIPPVAFNYAADPAGRLMLNKADDNGTILYGNCIAPDPAAFIVHRATLLTEVPEYFGGLLRPVLFWYLFGIFGRDWWARFLNRYGSPFIQGTYDPADPDSQFKLQAAMQAAQELFGVVIPEGTMTTLLQAQTAQGGQAFSEFISVANAEISKILLGQTLSSDAQNVGFGGGQATVQNDVRGEIKAFDALRLAAKFKQNYLLQLCRYNNWPVHLCPTLCFGSVSNDDLNALSDLIAKLGTGGLEVTDDAMDSLSEKFGFGIQRKPITEPGGFGGIPFSADRGSTPPDNTRQKLRRLPADRARTISQAEQAQAANDAIVDNLKDKLASALGAQGDAILTMLMASKSRAEFMAKLSSADLTVSPEAIDMIEAAMRGAAANGILASQPRIGRG